MKIRSLGALALAVCAAIAAIRQDVRAVPVDVILRAAAAPVLRGNWSVVADATAAGGSRLANTNAGAAKLTAPLASPSHYFEMTFTADAGTPYRLWLRGAAYRNSYANDSVFVQFSDSVTSGGAPVWRIGTTSGTEVNLEACSGCGLSGWGWQDNGWGTGVLGPLVYFSTSGSHTLRVQVREDGLSIDQIVLSPDTYLNSAPGAAKNDTTILTGGGTAPPPPPPSSSALVREPYLQQVYDRSAVIVWASREPGPARARVAGRDVAAVTRRYPASGTGMAFDYYQHEAAVGGLSPATTYGYDVFVGNTDVNAVSDRFTTAPAAGTGRAQFIIFGDSGTGSTDQQALAAVMDADTFDLAMHAGDIAYGNSGGTGDATYSTYQSWFFDVYRDWLRRRPFFPSPGNHDVRAGTSWGEAYLNLFVLPELAGAGAYPDHAERYYSFDYGSVHFVALDTEAAFVDSSRRAEQLRWLEADLSSTSLLWKVAYFHRSPYSSGGHGSDTAVRQAFGPLFEKYNVQLVLSAHDHGYERSVPWRSSTDTTRQAVTYIVTGGGGGPLYPVSQSAWTATSASRHHYVKVTIDGCDATIDAIGKDGAAFDRHRLDGCGQWGDAAPPGVSFVSPSAGASVSGTVTVSASASDDVRVEKVDLWIDGRLHAIDTTAPYAFAWDTRTAAAGSHALELRAYDIDGKRATSSRTVTVEGGGSTAGDVVIWAADVPSASVHGAWSVVADSTAAGGLRLWSAGQLSKQAVSASPASYFEATFQAEAATPYHLWVRMKADGNKYSNDSVSVQFDKTVTSSGAPVARIGTTSGYTVNLEDAASAGVHGWGWQDNGYDSFGAHLYFSSGGTQRIRIQVREDGASIDQIVISPGTYLTRAPGALKDDTTIVSR